MAVKIRADNRTIVCAAKSRKRKGDCYLDDGIHYALSVNLKVMSVYAKDKNGADLWKFHAPRKNLSK